MINVDRVYQRVLALANKEQRGYVTPQEFNLLANQAQMDIFEQYFYDLSQFRRVPGNDTVHADMVDILQEKISIFEQTQSINRTTALGVVPAMYNLNNLGNLYRVTTIRITGNIIVENVSRQEARRLQLSTLTSPTQNRPIYFVGENLVSLIGDEPGDIWVDYIRQPNVVNWTYVVVGEKALYNQGATDAQNFELHPSEETKLVVKILTLAGFTLKDQGLLQAASAEDSKSIQQEKQ